MESYRKEIAKAYPNLSLKNLRPLDPDGGQYNDVLMAESPSGPIIFRFPRNEYGVSTIKNELRLLGRLQNKTTLPVPNPIYTSQNTIKPGQVFMGYEMLPGKALLREHLITTIDDSILKKWADQMAAFLVELHTIPAATFNDLPTKETLNEYQRLYADIRQYLFPHLPPYLRRKTAVHFKNYFNNPTLQSYPIALRHGDFGSGNILFDPTTLNLTGIIDFGFAGPGDPALDIAALSTLGDTFFTYVKKAYPNVETLLARSSFYKGTFLLHEALYGLKTGSQDIFQEALKAYRVKNMP